METSLLIISNVSAPPIHSKVAKTASASANQIIVKKDTGCQGPWTFIAGCGELELQLKTVCYHLQLLPAMKPQYTCQRRAMLSFHLTDGLDASM